MIFKEVQALPLVPLALFAHEPQTSGQPLHTQADSSWRCEKSRTKRLDSTTVMFVARRRHCRKVGKGDGNDRGLLS
jgi:hypothetical protein